MAVTIEQLVEALRLGDSDAEKAIARRLMRVAKEMVEKTAPSSPAVIKDEACIRIAGYLYDMPSAARGASYAAVMRNSGAKVITASIHRLSGWRSGVKMLSIRQWVSGGLERRSEAQSAGYTDAILDLLTAQASGKFNADVRTGGALELAAGHVGRAFASARIETPSQLVSVALNPLILSHIGRSLIRAGEAVFAISTSGGSLALLPASTWDIEGGVHPQSWQYRLSIGAPNGTAEIRLPFDGVVHVRYAYSPEQAWRGLSPLDIAREAGRLGAHINAALADESGMPRGGILPMPTQPSEETTDKLERTLGSLRGAIMTAESMAASADGGYLDQPKDDWLVKRVGAAFQQPLVELRRDADALILGLCGVPIEFLTGADGSALREAYRRMLFGTIQPLGAIVADELSAKLETEISLEWDELRAADRASGARAYKALKEAGMDNSEALKLSGL